VAHRPISESVGDGARGGAKVMVVVVSMDARSIVGARDRRASLSWQQ